MKQRIAEVSACIGVIAIQFIVEKHIPLVISSVLPFTVIFFISIQADWKMQFRYVVLYTGLLNLFVNIPWGILSLAGLIIVQTIQWLRVQLTSGQSIGAFLLITLGSHLVWTAFMLFYNSARAAFGGLSTLPSIGTLLLHTFAQQLFILSVLFGALAIQRRHQRLNWTDLFAMLYERSVRPL